MSSLSGEANPSKRQRRRDSDRSLSTDRSLREEIIAVGEDGDHVRVLSDRAGSWGGTCGSVLWAASGAALPWLADRRALFEGCSVLELGAGLGLLGLGMAKLGARQVMLTDVPAQMPLLLCNAQANSEGPHERRVKTCALEWGKLPTALGAQNWDLVVGADLVYDEDAMPSLAWTLAALLRGKANSRALLALPDRAEFERGAGGKPDYTMLFDLLALPEHGSLTTKRVGCISSEDAGTLGSEIHILLVSHAKGDADGQEV